MMLQSQNRQTNQKQTKNQCQNTRTHARTHKHTTTISSPHTHKQWHALGREEQAKYYELARRERQLHMQMYPDWSSRTNASRGKKRKRKQDSNDGGS